MAGFRRMIFFLNVLGIFFGVQIIRYDFSEEGALFAGPLILGGFGMLVFNGATVSVQRHREQMMLLQGYVGMISSFILVLYPLAPALLLIELPSEQIGLWAVAIGLLNLVFLVSQRKWMKAVSETGRVPEELGKTVGE